MVNIIKVLYPKFLSNILTFNILSILYYNNIIDIIYILYIRGIEYNSTTYRGYRGIGVLFMPYDFILYKENDCFSDITDIYPLQITENQLFTPIYQI